MKKAISLILVLCIVFALCACGSTSNTPSTSSDKAEPSVEPATADKAETSTEPYVLKVNLTVGTTDPQYPLWQELYKRMEDNSEGTLKIEIYTDQTLGTNDEITQACANGAEFINVPDFAGLVDYCADASIYHVPYLIQRPEQISQLWKSEIGQGIDAELAENGIHVISAMYFGTRNVLSKKPITTADDFKSLKLRVGTSKMWTFTAETLGANATNTPWSETYQALSQGVADACESPSSLLYSSKMYENCKYLVKTEHLVCNSAVIMSQSVYDSLPDAAKKAIDEAGEWFANETISFSSAIAEEYDQKLIDEGVEISQIDKTPFIEYSKAHVEEAFPEWSEGLYQNAYNFLYGD